MNDTLAREEIAPFPGTLRLHVNDGELDGVMLSLAGGPTSTALCRCCRRGDNAPHVAATAGCGRPGWHRQPREFAKSHDRVMVPVSIVQKTGANRAALRPR